MRHLKSEVQVIKKGLDCGLVLGTEYEPKESDVIECYRWRDKIVSLNWHLHF